MDRRTLHRMLREARVPGGYYVIEGVHEPAPTPVDHLFLRRRGGAWETGVYERGRHEVAARFGTESEACAHLFRLLTGPGGPA
ncbi:hypothetical protein [Streptomyces sp. YIM 98790]|uniref:hypothetical protein n=1 Tax=Streptomyces sp. YIM 98790 TaxID=2689077 RepID=UPI0028BF10EE|nr:hypothetical protein [Streptomyces sp. YIM 98790]